MTNGTPVQGTGGIGGGGNAQANGGPNTGGGGGGATPGNSIGGNGGNGVVIITYSGAQRGSGGAYSFSGGNSYHTFTTTGNYSP
jgi:hypothetical protein